MFLLAKRRAAKQPKRICRNSLRDEIGEGVRSNKTGNCLARSRSGAGNAASVAATSALARNRSSSQGGFILFNSGGAPRILCFALVRPVSTLAACNMRVKHKSS